MRLFCFSFYYLRINLIRKCENNYLTNICIGIIKLIKSTFIQFFNFFFFFFCTLYVGINNTKAKDQVLDMIEIYNLTDPLKWVRKIRMFDMTKLQM
jgi:hypothetical protein